jgi:hypothetical protein
LSYFKIPDIKKQQVNLYPLPCFHVGARQSDRIFIEEHIARIHADPLARWVYMGDGGECVTCLSKGVIYKQVYSPQTQMEILVALLRPIKNKGLFMIRGNHGGRIFKESGLSFDKNLALVLGLPYLGVEASVNMVVNRTHYDLFFHHGVDSGVSLQTKINKAEQFSRYISADAIFTAHSHVGMELPPASLKYNDNNARKIKTLLRYQYICGSGYDSRSGYAQDKGYTPLLPQFIMVSFSGERTSKQSIKGQQYRRWHSDGTHEVDGIYPYAHTFGEEE